VLGDSFVSDDVGANKTRDKIQSVVGDQGIIFFLHGTASGRVGEGGMDEGEHQRKRRR
jgi:hypothetical protein